MEKTIKSIETEYKGYRFRSRLEARWAVFFDALNIKWEYEKEGFDILGVRYLPDFWLSTVNMWAEVKPDDKFDRASRNLALQLSNLTGFGILMLGGTPENRPYLGFEDNLEAEFCLTNYHDYPQDEHRFYGNPGDEDRYDIDPRNLKDGDNDRYWEDTQLASDKAKAARFEF